MKPIFFILSILAIGIVGCGKDEICNIPPDYNIREGNIIGNWIVNRQEGHYNQTAGQWEKTDIDSGTVSFFDDGKGIVEIPSGSQPNHFAWLYSEDSLNVIVFTDSMVTFSNRNQFIFYHRTDSIDVQRLEEFDCSGNVISSCVAEYWNLVRQ